MSVMRQHDRETYIFHPGAASVLFIVVVIAHLFWPIDLGTAGNTNLLFPALIFITGQPRGRRSWLIAISFAVLAIAAVGAGIPVIRWLAGGETLLEFLPAFAVLIITIFGVGIVRSLSGPDPEAANSRKPVTLYDVLSGLALGAAVFAIALYFWIGWADAHPEIAPQGMIIAYLHAFMDGALVMLIFFGCGSSDLRSDLPRALAGLAVAGMFEVSMMGGMALVFAVAPDRTILLAASEAIGLSAAFTIPAMYAAFWFLGRHPVETEEGAG